jgi:hypothetical protein
MQILVTILDENILDLFTGHGGSYSSWLHEFEQLGMGTGRYRAVYDLEEGEEGDAGGFNTFGPDDIAKGLGIMAQESPRQFGQFLAGDADDLTFDIALQCVVFGEVIFG